jgi:hypothetical protein
MKIKKYSIFKKEKKSARVNPGKPSKPVTRVNSLNPSLEYKLVVYCHRQLNIKLTLLKIYVIVRVRIFFMESI